MPWCPNCKYEYQDGFTVCSDCGATLVENYGEVERLETEAKEREAEEIARKREALAEMMTQMNADSEGLDPDFPNPPPSFVKAKEKAENYRSSAYALTLVGTAGLLAVGLCASGVIDVRMASNIRLIGGVVLSVMFLFFLVFGIRSFSEANKYRVKSEEEERIEDDIRKWFRNQHTAESIDASCQLDRNDPEDELKYFARSEYMKNQITEAFGAQDAAYLEHLAEELYSEIYEH